jgi:hypothetical protein
MNLGPDTKATLRLATIISTVGFIISATVFLWTIKTNGEQALAEIKEMRQEWKDEMVPCVRKVDRLWWDYEQKTRPALSQSTTKRMGATP